MPVPICTREELEAIEMQQLAGYAFPSKKSEGRADKKLEPDPRRKIFQRDNERISYSDEYLRLGGKAQVFPAYVSDHFRNRLTHTDNVEQISEDICLNLRLNADLARAIARGHDLGHTPFGHEGERVLNEMMQEFGLGFEHNDQSLEIAKKLNLSKEVLEGLRKHDTPWDNPKKQKTEDTKGPLLEALVVNLADETAYTAHDIRDGLRAGIISLEDVKTLALWQKAEKIAYKEFGEADDENEYIKECVSAIIGYLVNDIIDESARTIKIKKIKNLEDVYSAKHPIIRHSDTVNTELVEMREFLKKNLYYSDKVKDHLKQAERIIRGLFKLYFEKPEKMSKRFNESIKNGVRKEIVIKDYISGMTDHYAMEKAKEYKII